jgi:hypothetical protein
MYLLFYYLWVKWPHDASTIFRTASTIFDRPSVPLLFHYLAELKKGKPKNGNPKREKKTQKGRGTLDTHSEMSLERENPIPKYISPLLTVKLEMLRPWIYH